jgi:NADPH2:quinone reductase
VLVQAGAGGVGGFAVQLAARADARVFATCSAANAEYVKGLGAEAVIDYRSEDVAARVKALTGGRGVDAIVDTLSGESATHGINHLLAFASGIACIAGMPDFSKVPWGRAPSVHDLALGAAHASGDRRAQGELARIGDTLAQWVVQGRLRSTLERVVTLEQAPAALAQLGEGHSRGKTVVKLTS